MTELTAYLEKKEGPGLNKWLNKSKRKFQEIREKLWEVNQILENP